MTASGIMFVRAMNRLARRTAPLRIRSRRLELAGREPFVGPSVIPGRRRRRDRSLTIRECLEYLFWTVVVTGGYFLYT